MQNFSDFIMKCAIFEEHSSSCVVYSRFSGTLFPVSIIDGDSTREKIIIIDGVLEVREMGAILQAWLLKCKKIQVADMSS